MGEKQRATGADSDIELDPVIRVAIAVVISVDRTGPAPTIIDCRLRLSRPSGVIHINGNTVGWRRHRQQISNHHFVETDERMVDLVAPFFRPMPVNEITFRIAAIPIPLDCVPELCNALIEVLFCTAASLKVLASSKKPLHQK